MTDVTIFLSQYIRYIRTCKFVAIIYTLSLQETVKFMRAQITYDGPLVSYLTYDGPNSVIVDYSNLRWPRLDLCRLSLNYEGSNTTVVDYL
jgi:hypothetical protein